MSADQRRVPRAAARKARAMLYAQEFECDIIDAESSAFSSAMIEMALADDFERLVG